jgi:WD40 repeat protein
VRTIELDDGPATALAVDERRALTGHKGGTIVLWDLERAEKLGLFQHNDVAVASLAFTGAASQFAAASPVGGVALFDIRSPGAPVAALDDQEGAQSIASARWSGLLVSAGQDRSIRLWRMESRSLARTWRAGGAPTALDITTGGRSTASGNSDGIVQLWSSSTSRLQRSFKAHEGRVTALAFSPNDRLLASAGHDGLVKLWDFRSGRAQRVFRGHAEPVLAVAFSADGRRLLSAGQDGVIRVWQTTQPPQAAAAQ